jgi:FtsP/CotA-like multicopper oxidase with cupredoxin domain
MGAAERISAIVEMTNPGVWMLGDLSDDDRQAGMGVVVEYAGRTGSPDWTPPPPFRWDYACSPKPATPRRRSITSSTCATQPTTGSMCGPSTTSPLSMDTNQPVLDITHGKRYRLRFRNATDDIHPMHLHRHTFEITHVAGTVTAGIPKDVAMLGGYQTMDVDFLADQPGLSLLHCHEKLHMDFGFMTLLRCS